MPEDRAFHPVGVPREAFRWFEGYVDRSDDENCPFRESLYVSVVQGERGHRVGSAERVIELIKMIMLIVRTRSLKDATECIVSAAVAAGAVPRN